MNKKKWMKITAGIMAFFICLSAVPLSVFAAPEEENPGSGRSQMASWKEQEEMRGSSSRTFLSEDGTEVMALYPCPIFYQGEDGGWIPYDYRLEPVTGEDDGKEYQVKDGSMESSIRRFFSNGEFIKLGFGEEGGKLSFSLPASGSSSKKLREFKVQTGLLEEGERQNRAASENQVAAGSVRNSGVYEEIVSGMDLSIAQWPGKVELSAAFKTLNRAKGGVSFYMALDGLTFRQESDGSIRLFSGEEEVAVLEAPLVYDGKRAMGKASYQAEKQGDGSVRLSVVPDGSWMDEMSRISPITVNIQISQTGIKEEVSYEVKSTEGYFGGVPVVVGNTRETLQTVLSLPALPAPSEEKKLKQVSLLMGRADFSEEQQGELELGIYRKSSSRGFSSEPMDTVIYEADDKTELCMLDITEAYEASSGKSLQVLLKSVQTELVTGLYGFDFFVEDMLFPALLVSSTGGETTVHQDEGVVVGEDIEKRDRFTKHFLMEDGSYVAAVYEMPVHYEKDGRWEEIDNRLISDGAEGEEEGYINKASDVRVKFSRYSTAAQLVSMQSAGADISWELLKPETEETIAESTEEETEESSEGDSEEESESRDVSEEDETEESETEEDGSSVDSEESSPETEANETEAENRGQKASEFVPAFGGDDSVSDEETESAEESEPTEEEESSEEAEQTEESEPAGENDSEEEAGPEEESKQEEEESKQEEESGEEGESNPAEENRSEDDSGSEKGKYRESIKAENGKTVSVSNAEIMKLSGLTDGGSYENILQNVTLRYILDSVELKESIILKSRDAAGCALQFRVSHPGLEMSLEADGSVSLKKGQMVIYTFTAPYMYDWAGDSTKEVSLSLEKESEGVTILTVKPDENWLASRQRTYPVAIERTVEKAGERKAVQEAFVRENQPEEATEKGTPLSVGYFSVYGVSRTLVKLTHLPSLQWGDRIYKGVLNIYQNQYSTKRAEEFPVTAQALSADWKEDVTWSAQPDSDGIILDSQWAKTMGKTTASSEREGLLALKQFDITSQLDSWYGGENYGVLLRSGKEELKAGACYTISNRSSRRVVYPSGFYPTGLFYYRNQAGVGDGQNGHQQKVSQAGTGYVDGFTGNLSFSHEDVAAKGKRLPEGVSHIYNLNSAGEDTLFGNGWRLNVMERLEATGLSGLPYIYTDGDGKQYYSSKEDGTKVTASGLDFTIASWDDSGRGERWIMTGSDGSQRIFNAGGLLIRKKWNDGTEVSYEYGEGNRLERISDSGGTIISFTYGEEGGRLSSVKDETTGNTVRYQYDLSGNLTAITEPDGTESVYSYNERKLIQAKAADNTAADYLYGKSAGTERVQMFREWGTEKAAKTVVEFDYCDGSVTNVYDRKKEENSGSTYVYDKFGQVRTVVDDQGRVKDYVSLEKGSGNETAGKPESYGSVSNYLVDSGFVSEKFGNGHEWHEYNEEAGGTYSIGISSDTGRTDERCAFVSRENPERGTVAVGQDIEALPAGTYTASVYMQTSSVSPLSETEGGAFLGITYLSGSRAKTTELGPDVLTGTSGQDGWRRVSFTFSVPEGGADVCVWGGLKDAGGQLYLDDFQLEEGNSAGDYNLIENGSFEQLGEGSKLFGWTAEGLEEDGLSTGDSKFGERAVRLSGSSEEGTPSQTVNISGAEGDSYYLSGWAKANAVSEGEFRLGVEIHYSDGSQGWKYVEFDRHRTDWQYAGGTFTVDDGDEKTNLTYTGFTVYLLYRGQYNPAWFDGVQMTKL